MGGLDMTQQCALVSQKASGVLVYIKKQCGQQVKRGDSASLLPPGRAGLDGALSNLVS